MSPPPTPPIRLVLTAAGLIAALAAGGLVVGWTIVAVLPEGWLAFADVDRIERLIEGWGAWGVFASIGLMVLHSFLPFPAELVAIANGMVWGTLVGTLVTWTGAMLGAFVAFGLARALGRPFVRRLLARSRWEAVDAWSARSGWAVLLGARLIPVIAFNLINYAAGLSAVGWWTFTWTTGLGILPVTVLMVVMGDHIDVMTWEIWTLVLVVVALMAVAVHIIRNRINR